MAQFFTVHEHSYPIISLGPQDNHVILILQIGKLRFREIKRIIRYLNKEGGAGIRIQLVILLVHHTFSLELCARAWGKGEG